MVVHPAPGHYSGTLVNALMYHCGNELSGINGTSRPGIVHRIDMDTTGSLIICKNDMAHQSLAVQLKEHSINRIYEAIVHGNIKEEEGTVNAPIGRHPTDRKKMSIHAKNARNAITHYKVLKRFGDYTYIQRKLETGPPGNRPHPSNPRTHGKYWTPTSRRSGIWSKKMSIFQASRADPARQNTWIYPPTY